MTFPTTAEHLKEVFDRIGIDFKHYEEWHFTEFQSTIPGLTEHLSEYSHPDELNYLGKLLEMQFDDDRRNSLQPLNTATMPTAYRTLSTLHKTLTVTGFIRPSTVKKNTGIIWLTNWKNRSFPKKRKSISCMRNTGGTLPLRRRGMFTEQGYIYNNRNTFTEWYRRAERARGIPRNAEPPQPERGGPGKDLLDAAATGQTARTAAEQPQEPHPVIPIVLTAGKPAEKLKEITDRLEQGITELFDSERYKEYLKVMSKFHNYSFRNTVLIAMQKPDASLVAGFSAWKNNFERNVMKGQKGIKIIAPSPYKIKQEMQKIDPHTQKPIIGKDGKPVTEEKEITIPAYKVVSVFDVSQTEGKELPDIAVDELTGDVDRYKDFFAALEKTSPFLSPLRISRAALMATTTWRTSALLSTRA